MADKNGTPVQLHVAPPPGQGAVVRILEGLLQEARDGTIMSLIGVRIRTGGEWSQFQAGPAKVCEAVGMLEIAKLMVVENSRR